VLACSSKSQEIQIVETQKNTEFEVLNDTIFLGKIVDIDFYEGRFFLLDRLATKVYELDQEYQLIKTHLTQGDGPDEVSSLTNIAIHNKRIYLLDSKSSSIKSFLFDGSLDMKHRIPNLFTTDFIVESDNLFYGDFRGQDPIVRINLLDKESKGFGVKRSWPNKSFYVQRLLEVTPNKQLISALSYDKPILDLYEFNGQLVTSLDLSNLELFRYTHEKFKTDVQTRKNASLVYIKDISLVDNKIYLLVSSFTNQLKNRYNHVIECTISNNKITPTKIIKLEPDSYYLSISVYNGGRNIIGFDAATNSVKIFDINQN